MATKTDRILALLPRTFAPATRRSALRAVAGAPGGELLAAENSLAAVMGAHWVDHADRGAAEIDDLVRFAALYGLAPRADEDVERFRERLKRTVRLLIEGTVTVPGMLELAAIHLDLHLGPLDGWWHRRREIEVPHHQRFTSRAAILDEASTALFGFVHAKAEGRAATAAKVRGDQDLSRGIDLRQASFLRLEIDGGAAVEVRVAGLRPRVTTPEEILSILDAALPGIASIDSRRLTLTSQTAGATSSIRFAAPEAGDDARELLFGTVQARTIGETATPATLVGTVDLAAGADLSARSILRLAVDGGEPFEVEVAGATPSQTFADEVVAALDAVSPGLSRLTEDDRLSLTSPTAGPSSRLEIIALRHLELVEYPPEPARAVGKVRHGEVIRVYNDGAGRSLASVRVHLPQGAFGPALVHWGANVEGGAGTLVRLPEPLGAGSIWLLGCDESGGLVSSVVDSAGQQRTVQQRTVQQRTVQQRTVQQRTVQQRTVPIDQLRIDGLGDRPGAPAKPGDVLVLPRGESTFLYLECEAARFDTARFNRAHFAGGPCFEAGVFDVSRFTGGADAADRDGPVFANDDTTAAHPSAEVEVKYSRHQPGAFELVLPADLDPRFGGRFDAARLGAESGERYAQVALEPPFDAEDHLLQHLATSALVEATPVARAPLGFAAARVPFRAPQPLTLGDRQRPAALYLEASGLTGVLEIRAREGGTWGNSLAVVARPAGPGLYDVEILFPGARFENARQVVAGPSPPSLAEKLLEPAPLGVLQAKAAGVTARVRRDRAELDEISNKP